MFYYKLYSKKSPNDCHNTYFIYWYIQFFILILMIKRIEKRIHVIKIKIVIQACLYLTWLYNDIVLCTCNMFVLTNKWMDSNIRIGSSLGSNKYNWQINIKHENTHYRKEKYLFVFVFFLSYIQKSLQFMYNLLSVRVTLYHRTINYS